MAKGDPVQSPYVYDSGADGGGRHLTATFSFDNATRALSGLVVHRDPSCKFIAVLIGNPNGTPVRVPANGQIPAGDTTVTAGQLSANGFNTIEQVLALQITAATS